MNAYLFETCAKAKMHEDEALHKRVGLLMYLKYMLKLKLMKVRPFIRE